MADDAKGKFISLTPPAPKFQPEAAPPDLPPVQTQTPEDEAAERAVKKSKFQP